MGHRGVRRWSAALRAAAAALRRHRRRAIIARAVAHSLGGGDPALDRGGLGRATAQVALHIIPAVAADDLAVAREEALLSFGGIARGMRRGAGHCGGSGRGRESNVLWFLLHWRLSRRLGRPALGPVGLVAWARARSLGLLSIGH